MNELKEIERHGMKKFDFRYVVALVVLLMFGFWGYNLAIVAVEPKFTGTPTEFVSETNTIRALHDLQPVKENPILNLVAKEKCEDMVNRNYFEHIDPSGKEVYELFKARGLEYTHAGENLADNYSNTLSVIGSWYASPSHKANIVKPEYTEVGHAICLDHDKFKIVQLFKG